MYKTRFGLRLRACGEHPQAADSVGINVYKMRYAGVLISGFLGGVGGLAYTLAAGSGFNSDVGGYGFLALAVMIFGNWKPLPILGASLFFALFKVIAALNATLTFLPKFEGVKEISNFYQMLPYIVTMIVLIFTSKNSQAPRPRHSLRQGQPLITNHSRPPGIPAGRPAFYKEKNYANVRYYRQKARRRYAEP